MNFSKKDIQIKIDSFDRFLKDSADLYNSHKNQIHPSELAGYPDPELLHTAYSMGTQSWEACADHIFCFQECIKEPVKTVGIWTVVRGAMEAAAIATWVLNPSISAHERVGRQFAFRYEGLSGQLKLAKENGDPTVISNLEARIDAVETRAVGLGFPKLEKNGKRTGIGQHWPLITELTDTSLGMKKRYRMLSGVAHGHHWIMQGVCFRIVDLPNGEKALEKHLSPETLLILLQTCFECFAKVVFNAFALFEWELQPLRDLLNQHCDKAGYMGSRFWNAANA